MSEPRAPTSYDEQALAVEKEVLERRNHCSSLADLIRRGKRPQSDLIIASMSLPALEDAAQALRARADREAAKAKKETAA
jgi:hypothetical protein